MRGRFCSVVTDGSWSLGKIVGARRFKTVYRCYTRHFTNAVGSRTCASSCRSPSSPSFHITLSEAFHDQWAKNVTKGMGHTRILCPRTSSSPDLSPILRCSSEDLPGWSPTVFVSQEASNIEELVKALGPAFLPSLARIFRVCWVGQLVILCRRFLHPQAFCMVGPPDSSRPLAQALLTAHSRR